MNFGYRWYLFYQEITDNNFMGICRNLYKRLSLTGRLYNKTIKFEINKRNIVIVPIVSRL